MDIPVITQWVKRLPARSKNTKVLDAKVISKHICILNVEHEKQTFRDGGWKMGCFVSLSSVMWFITFKTDLKFMLASSAFTLFGVICLRCPFDTTRS